LPELYLFKKKLVFFNIGPYYSWLIHSERMGVSKGWNIVSGYTSGKLTGSEKYIRKNDCGLSASLGFCYRPNSDACIIPRLKYTYSFITRLDDKSQSANEPYIEKIRTLCFFLEMDIVLFDKKTVK
jgi:hypothetical protein